MIDKILFLKLYRQNDSKCLFTEVTRLYSSCRNFVSFILFIYVFIHFRRSWVLLRSVPCIAVYFFERFMLIASRFYVTRPSPMHMHTHIIWYHNSYTVILSLISTDTHGYMELIGCFHEKLGKGTFWSQHTYTIQLYCLHGQNFISSNMNLAKHQTSHKFDILEIFFFLI